MLLEGQTVGWMGGWSGITKQRRQEGRRRRQGLPASCAFADLRAGLMGGFSWQDYLPPTLSHYAVLCGHVLPSIPFSHLYLAVPLLFPTFETGRTCSACILFYLLSLLSPTMCEWLG